ncbi:hypothetical protein [Serratia bockelmannii]|uniref:hypothetical protein n=1 Tax=Serratia bockelmannii TaxID=2703793 RepID=UPI00223F5DB7|nr:hypothetical protein [Serratia bockelmannii]MCW7680531.1 hypothetical protein [Serratia bockelmannii]MCW7738305.1 hypothetical protein [Serratia bockelmannii]
MLTAITGKPDASTSAQSAAVNDGPLATQTTVCQSIHSPEEKSHQPAYALGARRVQDDGFGYPYFSFSHFCL